MNNKEAMGRIDELFKKKSTGVLNVYFTAGYPTLESTMDIMKGIQSGGADLIEIGMPYSDPLADGPVIQESSSVALENGMSIDKLFEQLKGFRDKITLPVVLMGYMNPVLQYGFERFCNQAAEVGVDGLILPDLPAYEFDHHYGKILREKGLDFVFLVTPETSESRVRQLDELSTGFLYAVSSSSTTGKDKDFHKVVTYLNRLKSYALKNPFLVGFGIKDKASFDFVKPHANGAIIGSAFIQALSNQNEPGKIAENFVKQVLNEEK
jgi:tryptophan synthase alpha chain